MGRRWANFRRTFGFQLFALFHRRHLYLDSLEQPLHESLLGRLGAQARSELRHVLHNRCRKRKEKKGKLRRRQKNERCATSERGAVFCISSSLRRTQLFFFANESRLARCLQTNNQRKMQVPYLFVFFAFGGVLNQLLGCRQATRGCWCWGNVPRDGHATLTDPGADAQ